MNTALYLTAYAVLALALGLAAWASPRTLRLPGLTRLLLGVCSAPLVLPVITLALTLVWPRPPRAVLLLAPALLAAALAAAFARRIRALADALRRRIGRIAFRPHAALVALAGVVLLHAAGTTILANARRPLAEHDALIYFNEARVFAGAPAWSTFLALANPAAPDALVSGHTHTWLYPTFIAPALLATSAAEPGAGHDFVARCAVQANLLFLLLAIGGLTWAVTRRHGGFSVAAMAGVAGITHVAYITHAYSLDAFRLLPLVLLATVLSTAPRRRSGWCVAAVLLALGAAAHTLNVVFVPLIVLARLLAGLPAAQWRNVARTFVPCAAISLLPVAVHYAHLGWTTGKLLGHGLHYPFYADSPLQAAARSGALRTDAPSLIDIVRTVVELHGGWWTTAPLLALGLGLFAGARRVGALRFLGLVFVLFWLVLASGVLPGPARGLTWMMLENFRYPLAIWVLGPPLVMASAASLLQRLDFAGAGPRFATARRVGSVALAALAVGLATWHIPRAWPISYDTAAYLAQGEQHLAADAARLLRPGENWLTDRNTVGYYSTRAPIFLYTPAGHRWIAAPTAADAWALLCAHRVRLVAFNHRAPDWWPRTALYAALTAPGHATRRDLPRWQVFEVNLPPAP